MKASDGESSARYRDLFADGQFSALFVADVLSKTGGQLGRFALIALVYDRTDSPALAAFTVAVIYLPGLTGGPILATLADRLPRRRLLITCDLLRSPLIAIIALATYADIPFAVPLALCILLIVGLLDAPFGAARQAILADILLDKDQFALGNSLVGASQQAVQVIGFGLGGVVVTAVGPQATLAIHAGAYLFSATVLAWFVRARPAPEHGDDGRPRLLRDALAGFKVVRDTARLPPLFWLLLVGPAVMITAEALAVPLAKELGITGMLRGVLMAAIPFGTAVGLTLTGRLSTSTRERLLLPFSVAVGAMILVAGLLQPAYAVAVCFFVSGVAMGHIAHLQFLIVSLVESNVRGRVVGFAQMMLQVAQCVAAILSGTVAQATSIRTVLVASGAAGIVLVLIGAVLRSPFGGKHRASPRQTRRDRRTSVPASGPLAEADLERSESLAAHHPSPPNAWSPPAAPSSPSAPSGSATPRAAASPTVGPSQAPASQAAPAARTPQPSATHAAASMPTTNNNPGATRTPAAPSATAPPSGRETTGAGPFAAFATRTPMNRAASAHSEGHQVEPYAADTPADLPADTASSGEGAPGAPASTARYVQPPTGTPTYATSAGPTAASSAYPHAASSAPGPTETAIPVDAQGRHLYVAGGTQSHRAHPNRPLIDDDEPLPWDTSEDPASPAPPHQGELDQPSGVTTAYHSRLRSLS